MRKIKNLYERQENLHNSFVSEKNHQWKGDGVGYLALHAWVRRRLVKPDKCPKCGSSSKLDLANLSNEYRRDLSDWEWLCRRCHMNKDGRILNLRKVKASIYKKVECAFCKKWFKPIRKTNIFCSKKCKCDNICKMTISRFTMEELSDIKTLPYTKVYEKYNITQRVVRRIKDLPNLDI